MKYLFKKSAAAKVFLFINLFLHSAFSFAQTSDALTPEWLAGMEAAMRESGGAQWWQASNESAGADVRLLMEMHQAGVNLTGNAEADQTLISVYLNAHSQPSVAPLPQQATTSSAAPMESSTPSAPAAPAAVPAQTIVQTASPVPAVTMQSPVPPVPGVTLDAPFGGRGPNALTNQLLASRYAQSLNIGPIGGNDHSAAVRAGGATEFNLGRTTNFVTASMDFGYAPFSIRVEATGQMAQFRIPIARMFNSRGELEIVLAPGSFRGQYNLPPSMMDAIQRGHFLWTPELALAFGVDYERFRGAIRLRAGAALGVAQDGDSVRGVAGAQFGGDLVVRVNVTPTAAYAQADQPQHNVDFSLGILGNAAGSLNPMVTRGQGYIGYTLQRPAEGDEFNVGFQHRSDVFDFPGARDTSGASVSNFIMGGYRWGGSPAPSAASAH